MSVTGYFDYIHSLRIGILKLELRIICQITNKQQLALYVVNSQTTSRILIGEVGYWQIVTIKPSLDRRSNTSICIVGSYWLHKIYTETINRITFQGSKGINRLRFQIDSFIGFNVIVLDLLESILSYSKCISINYLLRQLNEIKVNKIFTMYKK